MNQGSGMDLESAGEREVLGDMEAVGNGAVSGKL